MWKKLENTHYYLYFTDKLEIFVTDFVTIWFCYYSNKSFLADLRESNFILDIDENELMQKGKHMLTCPEELEEVTVAQDGSKLVVSMTVSFGFPLKLNMTLVDGSKELFFQKVTQQLLKTVHSLRTSQHELRHLLQKKDKEIEEYKCEGGEIALRHLKTIPFNDEAHLSKHNVYEENLGLSHVPDDLLIRVVHVANIDNEVKQEPSEEPMAIVKPEPETQIKIETIKVEPQTKAQVNLVSSRKRQINKLNI